MTFLWVCLLDVSLLLSIYKASNKLTQTHMKEIALNDEEKCSESSSSSPRVNQLNTMRHFFGFSYDSHLNFSRLLAEFTTSKNGLSFILLLQYTEGNKGRVTIT